MEDDKAFIERARNGDTEAFLRLYDLYFDRIFKFVYYKVGHHEEAEDITQDTFLKAIEGIKNFEGRSKFLSWLMQIAKFTIMDYFRHKYKYPTVELEDYLASFEDNFDFDDDSEAADQKFKENKLRALLSKLPENYRQVLECRFLENLTLKETAERMQTNLNNVKILQYRALAKASQLRKP
ncbi:RNA polymerase sigma factor [Candidatus Peregrinibacteria bacterium]|nr:RNA polymerase sigma factor [Candidatus Peregrinibacteria bacterium]